MWVACRIAGYYFAKKRNSETVLKIPPLKVKLVVNANSEAGWYLVVRTLAQNCAPAETQILQVGATLPINRKCLKHWADHYQVSMKK